VLLVDIEGRVRPMRGIVFDRSAGGLAVVVEEQVPPGRVLDVRVIADVEMPGVPVTVQNVRREGNNYLLGCQFLRLPSWNIQLLFG
jgi:hypothetical protein